MKLFSRRKKQNIDPALPPELQAYSRSGRRERIGIVWLVGIVSLIISLLVMALLYFGGRWIYRKIAHRGSQPTPVIITDQQNSSDTDTGKDSSDTDSEDSFDQDTDSEQTTTGTSNQNAPQTQPVTGDQATDASSLPSTGPAFDL